MALFNIHKTQAEQVQATYKPKRRRVKQIPKEPVKKQEKPKPKVTSSGVVLDGWNTHTPKTNTHAEVSTNLNGNQSLILGDYIVGKGWQTEFGKPIVVECWRKME